MKRFILLCSLAILMISMSGTALAQVYPDAATGQTVDSLVQAMAAHQQSKDEQARISAVRELDKLLTDKGASMEYRGLISMVQAYHSTGENNLSYRKQAANFLRGRGKVLVDSLAGPFYTVLRMYLDNKRMEEWWPIDTLYRQSVNSSTSPDALRYGLVIYADQLMKGGHYETVSQLAYYDFYSLTARNSANPLDKLTIRYNDWLIEKVLLKRWMAMPYYRKHLDTYEQTGITTLPYLDKANSDGELRAADFQAHFTKLISYMQELKKETVLENKPGTQTYNESYRAAYYNIYGEVLNGFYQWAVNSHQEGRAIRALQNYLFDDLIPNEIDPAIAAKRPVSVNVIQLTTLVSNLVDLYNNTGNSSMGDITAGKGVEILDKLGSNLEGADSARFELTAKWATSVRLNKNYNRFFRLTKALKTLSPLPATASSANKHLWEKYMTSRLEELYGFQSLGEEKIFKDSLEKFVYSLDPLDKAGIIYETKGWVDLMHLAAIQEVSGKWKSVEVSPIDMLKELVDDIETQQGMTLQVLYPVQLLWLKAYYKNTKAVSSSLLSNLLQYTEIQLKNTFLRLSPTERMRLYEERLNPYFNVYHELLFSNKLDSLPKLKEKIIAQSLYLKSAMADGNLIPNEFLAQAGNAKSIDWTERFRSIRQEVELAAARRKLEGDESLGYTSLRLKAQSMWLERLEEFGMDSLSILTDWKKISSRLKPGQVYLEFIRYSATLRDSSAQYGVYMINPGGKLNLIPLYSEKEILALLTDPTSSPQTASLNTQNGRGTIGSSKNIAPEKIFVKGSVDKLGQLLLKPIMAHTAGAKEWLMVQDGVLNRISFAALQWGGKYLFELLQLQQFSSSGALFTPAGSLSARPKALLAGGLQYGTPSISNKRMLFKAGYAWNYLPGTKKETEILRPIFQARNISLAQYGNQFVDTLLHTLPQFELIHLATHGFYMDSVTAKNTYADRWNQEQVKYEPLFRSGIAVSGANNPVHTTGDTKSEGYLLGYELANTDLRKAYLVTLSACETGLGDIKNNLGVDGLPRALKLAGAQNLLISLWKVPDQPTAVFMEKFYTQLFSGKTPAQALAATQLAMSSSYTAADWAAFVLLR